MRFSLRMFVTLLLASFLLPSFIIANSVDNTGDNSSADEIQAMSAIELSLSQTEGVITLRWTLPQLLTNGVFFIERSKDDDHYNPVGIVKAHENVTAQTLITFLDKNIDAGSKYTYRLRKISVIGQPLYSAEVSSFGSD